MSLVKLVSSDGKEFEVSKDIAFQSTLLKDIINDLETQDAIPIPSVDGKTLEKVIEFCKKDDKDDKWNKIYIDVDSKILFDIIKAANYLDIQPLLDLGTRTVADSIRGKSIMEIREIFDITEDFTQEDMDQIDAENKWMEENA